MLSQRYFQSGNVVPKAYQGCMRYITFPYRSIKHGKMFINNHANPIARRYSRFESLGSLPEGAEPRKIVAGQCRGDDFSHKKP